MAWPTTHTAQMSHYDGYDVLIIEVIALMLMFGLNKVKKRQFSLSWKFLMRTWYQRPDYAIITIINKLFKRSTFPARSKYHETTG